MLDRSRLGASRGFGSSFAGDLSVAAVPWLVSRALVLASLAVARRVVDIVGAHPRPVALHQGLLAWDGAFYGDIARGGYA